MVLDGITPKGLVQYKITEIVGNLKNKGLEPVEIYGIIENLFPFLSDDDMYYLDNLLHIAHLGDKIAGQVVFNDIRIALGNAEGYRLCGDWGNVTYTMARRTQISEYYKYSDGLSLLMAAVKVVNPAYGIQDVAADLKVALFVGEEKSIMYEKECNVVLSAEEYTKVVYFPLVDFMELEELDGGKDFRVDAFCTGVQEPVLGKTFKYIESANCIASSFNIITDPYTVDGYMSAIGMDKEMEGAMTFCLCTSMFSEGEKPQQIEIAMKMEKQDTFTPKIAFLRYLDFCKMKGRDVYKHHSRVFGLLERLDSKVFDDGLYKMSFSFMGVELFSLKVNVLDRDISLVERGVDFTPADNLGDNCDIEDYVDDYTTDGYSDDDFDKLLDQFIENYNEEMKDSVGSNMAASLIHVTEKGMCASAERGRIIGIESSDFFLIRPSDTHLHFYYRTEGVGSDDDLYVRCSCLATGGITETEAVKVNDGIIHLALPIKSICGKKPQIGDEINFEVELLTDSKVLHRKDYVGIAIDTIFDLIELGSVAIANQPANTSLSDGLESMIGFKLEEMNNLHLQFEVKCHKQLKREKKLFMAQLVMPGDLMSNLSVEEVMDNGEGFTLFMVKYDSYLLPAKWVKGRYELSVHYSDNQQIDDDILKVTFTVGDWNVPGTYDVNKIKREVIEETYAKRMEQERKQDQTQDQHPEQVREKTALDKLQSMIGLEQVKKEIEDLRQQLELASRRKEMGLPADMPFLHSRFYGNPGTGKTTVAKLLGQIYKEMGLLSKGHVVFAERKTLIAGRWYDSANVATMEAIDKAQGGILFIDEAYNLAVPEDPRDPGQDIISSLMTALSDESRKDWMLILAGYPDKMETMMTMNEGFKSRVPNVFHFNDYNPDDLLQIAYKYCKDHVYTLTPKADEQLKAVIARDYAKRGKNFENGRYVINLLETNIIKRMGKRLSGVRTQDREMLTTILPEDIPSLRSTKGSRKLDMLNNMIGLTQLKESIQSHLNYVKLCNNRMMAGLSSQMPPLHMVFTGNPGTGKTTVADFMGEIYASMGILSEGRVLKYTKKDLVGFWIGDTERTMRELMKRAKGNLLFIDEAYELNPHGDEKDRGRIILDALVDELGNDHADMIVILAGYQKEMEELMEYNPGLKSRFPNVFHFNDYSVEELMKIALTSKVAEGFVFTSTAKQRLEAYIRREVLKKQRNFGNGRFVTRLISGTILPRMATRLSGVDNPTTKQLQTIMAEDIPITADEAMAVNETGFNEKLINESLAKLDALVGLQKVKKAIHNFVDVARYRNSIGEKFVGGDILKWSFTGNTGTGKSTVAKIFADILKGMNLLPKGNFVEVKGEQIFNVSEHTCDEVLKSAVDRSRYGMLFIDGDAPELKDRNAYALTNDQLKIKLMELTAEHGGAGAIIIAECNAKRQTLVSSMTSNGIYEFDHTFVFDDYTPDELYQILAQCLSTHRVRFTPEATGCICKYIRDMFEDGGAATANARTMKLLSRTIYEVIMLRESKDTTTPRRTVCLCDVENFVWKNATRRVGYKK